MEEIKNNQAFGQEIKDLPKVGENIEGTVISNERNTLYVDLKPYGTGIIFGREYLIIKDIIKDIVPGVSVTAKVVDLEGENGYIELSLKEAKEMEVWKQAEEYQKDGRVLPIHIKDANKGGLMVTWQGLTGFVPVSQLSEAHYPKVSGGDKTRILAELKKLVGEQLQLSIITVDPKEKKLIFSEKKNLNEKSPQDSSKKTEVKEDVNMMERYSIGDILEAKVIGVVDFGIFVKLPSGDEGLVHISEISWSLIGDPKSLYKVGDTVKVKVIEINKDKVSLSIKALVDNPWKTAGEKYKKGDTVKAVVIKISEHGALVSVEEGIYGLVHVSEFKNEEELKEKLQLGDTYEFKINVFDIDSEKMTLVLA
ncbi:30S ribosomal protein S1 [Candidatus Campbellbacteria bacterium]|nr:MAG: 30S ribosomal protein S1 [Candidatus Campbellbacteria bacterium]